MGLRYRIPFKDYMNNSYEVLIYREDYSGEPTELVGAPSCFVVTGTDEDFIYTPVRTSSATISVIDSDLLLDLYSINNQYAPVKLYRNGVLEWTGYIKPEQFTQPYVNGGANVSVECVGALATLEHVEYKEVTDTGYITMMDVIRYMVESAHGGYRGVYIPHVYGSSSAMTGNVLDEIVLCEENFTSEDMKLMEVMEAVCKFLNWTVWEHGGYLWFVDSDWKGEYRLYDEDLTEYVTVTVNAVTVQDVGYNGSDGNVLDVVPGYNKARVKSINNVFDVVIPEEPFDILKVIQTWEYNEGDFEDARRAVRRFKEPMLWEMYYYDHRLNPLSMDEIKNMEINTDVVGCVEVSENGYRVTEKDGEWVPDVSEFEWVDMLKIRLDNNSVILNAGDDRFKAFTVKGVNSIWKDGAFGINMEIRYTTGALMVDTAETIVATYLYFMLRIGDRYWNGDAWVEGYSLFKVYYNVDTKRGFQSLGSNKNANMPYRGLRGHVIELPENEVLKGDFEFTMFMNNPAAGDISGYFIKDFSLDYAKKDGIDDEGEDGDRVYENIVNENYMNDTDEIEFGIGSYNEDGATYSKALLNGDFLTDNLYCAIVGENIRPEELMIRRIVNRYGVTKIKLTEALRMTDEITPLTSLSDRSMVNKRFRMTSGEWDYEQNRLTLQMQEDAV